MLLYIDLRITKYRHWVTVRSVEKRMCLFYWDTSSFEMNVELCFISPVAEAIVCGTLSEWYLYVSHLYKAYTILGQSQSGTSDSCVFNLGGYARLMCSVYGL